MAQVFLSYSRKDISFVTQLATDLKNAGFDVWYDVSGIKGGSRWRVEIEKGIRNSQFVIVVLSPDSIASEWVEREFLFASNLGRNIIPLMYRPCELPLNYLNLNYIDIQGENYDQSFDKLLGALSVDATTLPASKAKRPLIKLKTEYVIAIMGALVAIFAAVLFQLYRKLPATPLPTATIDVIQASTPLATNFTDEFGVELVLVPEGSFIMGSGLGEAGEKPAHRVELDSFYIDKYEVTNKLYKECVDAAACPPPYDTSSATRQDYFGNHDFDNYPVIFVDWEMAKLYCEWRNARLPMEAEWEKSARGTDERIYPWGGDLNENFANYNQSVGDTTRVGNYEIGKGLYGVYDLAGNVWEWVNDWYSETYYEVQPDGVANPTGPEISSYKVLRGGSWMSNNIDIRSYRRFVYSPSDVNNDFGFRCARDAKP